LTVLSFLFPPELTRVWDLSQVEDEAMSYKRLFRRLYAQHYSLHDIYNRLNTSNVQ
jgi:hypothetical protein